MVLLGYGVEFTWGVWGVPKGCVLPGTCGLRTEAAYPVLVIQNTSCRGAILSLNRKQWNKRFSKLVASLCPEFMFLESSEGPAGQMQSSGAARAASELCPAVEKAGTPE